MSKTHTPSQLPHSHAQRWLLAHDICEPKRLRRVWQYLRQEGVRMQHSVYLLKGDRLAIERVMEQLRSLIDERCDDVRIYPLTENTRLWGLGTQFNDGSNQLCDAFMDKLREPVQASTDKPASAHKKLSF
jgi:CRISPR-associated protein Cas2